MPSPSKTTNKTPAIDVQGLSVDLGGTSILKDLTFTVPHGKVSALLGPNGSGKTTLLRALLGLQEPNNGTVKLLGKPLSQVRTRIGYVPQQFPFDRQFPITVQEFLKLHSPTLLPDKAYKKAIKEVGLTPLVMNKLLGTLSGGQLQRVLIAQAILTEPDLLFLDEPAANIDVAGEALLYDIIDHLNKDHGTTVFMVSHDISVISRIVDHVVCLNRQLLCSGSPKKTLTQKTVSQLYGHDTDIYHHKH